MSDNHQLDDSSSSVRQGNTQEGDDFQPSGSQERINRQLILHFNTVRAEVRVKTRSEQHHFNNQREKLVNRAEFVEKMNNFFAETLDGDVNNLKTSKSVKTLILHGVEGVGKTALAQFYFSQQEYSYHFRACFDAANEETLRKAFFSLAGDIHLLKKIQEKDKILINIQDISANTPDTIKEVIRGVKNWLGTPEAFCQVFVAAYRPNVISHGEVILYKDDLKHWNYCFKAIDHRIISGKLDNIQPTIINRLNEKYNGLSISRLMGINITSESLDINLNADSNDVKRIILGYIQYKKYVPEKCLLIFDGAPEKPEIQDFLPVENADVIITSTIFWPDTKIPVGNMLQEEAIKLAKTKLGSDYVDEDENIKLLIEKIGTRPVDVIKHTTIINDCGWNLSEYINEKLGLSHSTKSTCSC